MTLALRVWRNPQISPAWETGPYYSEFLSGNVGKLQNQLVTEAFWPNAILAAVYLVLGLYHLLIARRNTGLREFFWFGLFSVVLAATCVCNRQVRISLASARCRVAPAIGALLGLAG